MELIRLRIKGSEYPDSDAMAAAVGATMIPAVGRRDINLMPRLRNKEATLRRIKLTRAVASLLP